MSINNTAIRFICGLKGNVDFLSVKQHYERKGWKIVLFNENTPTFKKLQLDSEMCKKGFISSDEQVKYIFINSHLEPKEKRNVIFHEAGHIELKHMLSDLNEDAKERSATEFENILIRYCEKKNALLFLFCIVIVLPFLLFAAFKFYQNTGKEQITYSSGYSAKAESNLTYVYVTRTGKKYHIESCPHIKNNISKQKIDFETAEKLYQPCLDCIE